MSADHSGHRQRLKKALRENGLMSFSPHEVIELMLYTALPRRDVNELAHDIDDQLGGVCGLIEADKEALLKLGLSSRTAGTLRAYADCVRAYTASFNDKAEDKNVYILNRGDLDQLVGSLHRPCKRMLALLSASQEIVFTGEVAVDDPARFIAEKALVYDASGAVMTCDGGVALDEKQFIEIKEKLKLIDVRFDQYIVEGRDKTADIRE